MIRDSACKEAAHNIVTALVSQHSQQLIDHVAETIRLAVRNVEMRQELERRGPVEVRREA